MSTTRPENYAPPRIVIGTEFETRTDLSIQDWRVGESTGWGRNGKWKVHVTRSGPYDATLSWSKPIGRRDVTLSAGGWTYRGVLQEGTTQVKFDNIQLPIGNRDIGVELNPPMGSRDETIRFVTFEQDFDSELASGLSANRLSGQQNLINPTVQIVDGHQAFVMTLDRRVSPSKSKPWVFYAPTLPRYPDKAEAWMHSKLLDAGIAIAGIDVGEAYGSPKSIQAFEALHAMMVSRGYSNRPAVLGRSRGGLWAARLAIEHPEWVAGIGGIYPVFDCLSYPGIKKASKAYGVDPQRLENPGERMNPVTRLDEIADAKIPIYIIHGDEDKVVPLEENTAKLIEAYEEKGLTHLVTLNVASGQGHSFWEGFFNCEPLIDFLIERATTAAVAKDNP